LNMIVSIFFYREILNLMIPRYSSWSWIINREESLCYYIIILLTLSRSY
jgi:hypothetical protein